MHSMDVLINDGRYCRRGQSLVACMTSYVMHGKRCGRKYNGDRLEVLPLPTARCLDGRRSWM